MLEGMDIVWEHRDELIAGLGNTLLLTLIAAIGATTAGALLTTVLTSRSAWLSRAATAFVDLMRCTPFLLLAYFLYYGLPSLGLRFANWTVGIFALVIYNTAYVAEILRAAWASLPLEEIDAARAFGFHGAGLYRRIIFPRIFTISLPVLGNQLVQIIKDSSFLTIIAVPELTYAANNIQSNYYVPFSAFIAAVLLYWILSAAADATVAYATRRTANQR